MLLTFYLPVPTPGWLSLRNRKLQLFFSIHLYFDAANVYCRLYK